MLYRNQRSADAIITALTEMWDDTALAARAMVLAESLRAATPKGALIATREALAEF